MNTQEWIDPKNWKNRRRYLYAVTVFTMVAIVGAMFGPAPPTVAEAVVAWGFGALVMLTGTYVFGAVWDHDSVRKMITRKPDPSTDSPADAIGAVNPHGGPGAP